MLRVSASNEIPNPTEDRKRKKQETKIRSYRRYPKCVVGYFECQGSRSTENYCLGAANAVEVAAEQTVEYSVDWRSNRRGTLSSTLSRTRSKSPAWLLPNARPGSKVSGYSSNCPLCRQYLENGQCPADKRGCSNFLSARHPFYRCWIWI